MEKLIDIILKSPQLKNYLWRAVELKDCNDRELDELIDAAFNEANQNLNASQQKTEGN